MSFWIVQAQENPAEPRSELGRREWRSNTLTEVLADRGHDVVRWRSAFSHQAKVHLADENETRPHDNYRQRFIKCPPYHRHIGFARIRNHHVLGQNFLKSARLDNPPQVIHVGNVPISLAHACVRYGKDVGCPVVVDIRDLWPDIYADLLPRQLSGIRPVLIKALHSMSFRLKWTLREATAITGLTEPYMQWALALAGRARHEHDRVFPMCYPRRDETPPQKELDSLRQRLDLKPSDRVAIYLGNIGFQSDFDMLIASARRLKDRFPDFKMVIAGSGPREEELRREAKDITSLVVPGWLHGPEMASLLHIAQIGLIAFHPVPNYLMNIPNKFSEYLAGGLAIACGLPGEMARLTQEAECGFVYPSGDLDAFCQSITEVLDAPGAVLGMGKRARDLHARHFDGARIYPAFAEYLETIAGAKNSRPDAEYAHS